MGRFLFVRLWKFTTKITLDFPFFPLSLRILSTCRVWWLRWVEKFQTMIICLFLPPNLGLSLTFRFYFSLFFSYSFLSLHLSIFLPEESQMNTRFSPLVGWSLWSASFFLFVFWNSFLWFLFFFLWAGGVEWLDFLVAEYRNHADQSGSGWYSYMFWRFTTRYSFRSRRTRSSIRTETRSSCNPFWLRFWSQYYFSYHIPCILFLHSIFVIIVLLDFFIHSVDALFRPWCSPGL